MDGLGIHVIADLKQCDPLLIDDIEYVRDTLYEAAETLSVSVIGESFHKFSPQGVTGILSIAESHISVHTWPEALFVAIDIFTCGIKFDPNQTAIWLGSKFKSEDFDITVIDRGAGLALPTYGLSE